MSRRHKLLAAIALAAAALAPATGAAESRTLIVGTGVDPSFTPLYVAFELDLFEARGIDAELKLFSSGSAAVPALISGDINISLGTPAAPLLNHMVDPKVVMVAQFARQQGYSELVGSRDIAHVTDLVGKRVGFELGTATEVFALEVLAEHGLSVDDITHVNLQPPEGLAALQRDDLDAVFSFKPWSERIIAAMPDRLHVIAGAENYYSSQNVNMDRTWAEANPETAVAFLDVLNEAIGIAADKDRAAELVGAQLRMEASAVRPLLDLNAFRLVFDEETVRLLKREVDLQQRTGRLGNDFSYEAFVYTVPLETFDPARVSYELPK